MRISRPILISLLVATSAAALLSQQQFWALNSSNLRYVAKSGNDSNPGTQASPWLTIAHAESAGATGVGVVVGAGTYTENVTFSKGIRWVASGVVVLQPSSTTTIITGATNASWDGFTFSPNGSAYTLELDGSSTGVKTVRNCTFSGNPTTNVIEFQGGGTPTFLNPTVTVTAGVTSLFNKSTGGNSATIKIIGGTFTGVSTSSPAFNVLNGTETVDFESFSVTLSSVSQAAAVVSILNQPAPKISGLTIDSYTADSGIHVYSTGTTVGAAMITGNTVNMRLRTASYAIYLGDDNTGSGNLKLNGSTVDDNIVRGYRYFNPATDPTDLTLHGILIGHQINAEVMRNNVAGALYTIVAKGDGCTSYTWTSGVIAYNVGWNQQTNATTGGVQGLYPKAVCGTKWYNNTIWLGLTSGSTSSAVLGSLTNSNSDAGGSVANNTTFRNNFIGGVDIGKAFAYDNTPSGNTWDYDGYYASNSFGLYSGGGGFGNNGSGFLATFALWKAAGYDAHSVYGDPLFTSPSTGDFTLQGGSPLINAGLCITGVTPCPTNIGAK